MAFSKTLDWVQHNAKLVKVLTSTSMFIIYLFHIVMDDPVQGLRGKKWMDGVLLMLLRATLKQKINLRGLELINESKERIFTLNNW